VFHAACVAELRKFKLKQACPLCRTPLPPGPDKLHEEATLRYLVFKRRVERGNASWGALTKDEQREIHAVVGGLRAAADQGRAEAQYNLGKMFASSTSRSCGRGLRPAGVGEFVEQQLWHDARRLAGGHSDALADELAEGVSSTSPVRAARAQAGRRLFRTGRAAAKT
jgi:hypothetical protein